MVLHRPVEPAREGPNGRPWGAKPTARFVGLGVTGAILRAPAMAGYLSAYCRGSTTQTLSDDPHRAATGHPTGDVFAFGQCQCTPRTATDRRSDPPVARQQEMDDLLILAECSTNRI